MMDYYSLFGRFVRMLPPETAHKVALAVLRMGIIPSSLPVEHPVLITECFGLTFRNPVGMSAGLDNNAVAVDALLAQGFGFVEAGGVTPLPQPGNPRPRIFRLKQEQAVINRMGFPNLGVHAFADNLKKRRKQGILGANIAKNKDSLNHVYDYLTCMDAIYPYVDYITINISSPNTVGLRDLQKKSALSALMLDIERKRVELALATRRRKPVLYKIAPDLTEQDKEDIVEVALAHNIDGLIVTNTTVSRPANLHGRHTGEKGGLSGRPLFEMSTAVLRDVYRLSGGKIPLIGVGGIASPEDAYAKVKSGASLLQLYTALIYQGFGLVGRINRGLVTLLERDGFRHIREAVGVEVKR